LQRNNQRNNHFFLLQKQNNLIAGLRATNNAAAPTQEVEKGKEEKGKEVSVDREEETETKVRFFNLHFICFHFL